MAYAGYLIKVGDYEIPAQKYIKAQSYKVSLNIQDLDSYRDANGVLHRNVLEHKVGKVEFETPAMLTNKELAEFFKNISEQYTVPAERKFIGTVYIPIIDDYISQDMYMVDPAITIYRISDNEIKYNPIRIAFIGY